MAKDIYIYIYQYIYPQNKCKTLFAANILIETNMSGYIEFSAVKQELTSNLEHDRVWTDVSQDV